jgi:hypothetical protein
MVWPLPLTPNPGHVHSLPRALGLPVAMHLLPLPRPAGLAL